MSDTLRSKPIAIKFGSSASTNSNQRSPSSSRSKLPPPRSQLGKRPRSSAFADDDDDDDEGSNSDSDGRRGRHEKITGFGERGAETSSKRRRDGSADKKTYVIERQPNRDWKSEARAAAGRGNGNPQEGRAAQNGNGAETQPADQDTGLQWGLVVKNRRQAAEDEGNTNRGDTPRDLQSNHRTKTNGSAPNEERRGTPSINEQAVLSLMGKELPGEAKTIPSESDALQRDLSTAGEASTLADYEAMPVEEFGAALLRGMGWNGEERGPKVKDVKRRPNRLGLGAKELKGDEELGGWNQQGKRKDGGSRRPKLSEYRREEEKRKEKKREGREDSYKRERDAERDYERSRGYHDRNGHSSSRGHRDRDYDRDRRR